MDKVQKINADYYTKNAAAWAAAKTDSFFYENGFREFIKYLKPGSSVIDIGCAYGIHVPLFLGIGNKLKYSGIDISEGMLELARSRYPQMKFDHGNILDRQTLPNNKFDAFWAVAILMHIPMENWNNMLENLEQITIPGGIGFLTLPKDRPNPTSETDKRHFTLFSDKETFPAMARQRGWEIIESGEKTSHARTTTWFWYIVKLPKK